MKEEQAHTTAEQLLSTTRVTTSTGVSFSSQNLILEELKRMSERFGKLEEQVVEDHPILSGLVVALNKQGQVIIIITITIIIFIRTLVVQLQLNGSLFSIYTWEMKFKYIKLIVTF